MGKTPEKATSSASAVNAPMRYRRKAPTAAATEPTAAPPNATESERTQQDDNQNEHRDSEFIGPDKAKKAAVRQHTARSGPDKALPPAATRKKKPKASDDGPIAAEPKAATATSKKKLKKRQLADSVSENNNVDPADEAPEAIAPPTITSTNANGKPARKRKSNAGGGGTSLLKQLLWKAKPVSPPSDLSSPVDDRPVEEADGDEEEVAYTVSERQHRKQQAAKRAIAPQPVACSPVELSSQETQSGSDDDESSPAFTGYQNLVPSTALELPVVLPQAVQFDTFFPTPFPLALASDASLLAAHGISVHHVAVEDFAFHPPSLRVRPGDVVLWRVSDRTLAMVEHALEVTVDKLQGQQRGKKPAGKTTTTTPPLGAGAAFALRFPTQAYVRVECSVYETKGVVVVAKTRAKKEKAKQPVAVEMAVPVAAEKAVPVAVEKAVPVQQPKTTSNRRKEKAARRREAQQQQQQQQAVEEEVDDGSSSVVFHPPSDLMQSTEMDEGVCREVLTQLEEVVAATAPVILIGDVECPVLSTNQEEEEEGEEGEELLTPETKPSAVGDEWSGTDDDDEEDGEERAEEEEEEQSTEGGEIEDFQQRIIGMLRRSEELRAQQRHSFHQDESGFDAGAAYDFFKRRFMQAQEDRAIVYSVCPEPQSSAGVGLTDVVSLLTQ